MHDPGLLAPDIKATLDTEAILDAAFGALRAGDSHLAQACCRRVMTVYPREPGALHILAIIACNRHEPQQALAWIDAAIREDPTPAPLHHTRGQALAALGRVPEAEAAYRQAWTIRPGTGATANNLACLLRDVGRVTEALDWFRRADAVMPDVVEIVCNLARALTAAEDFTGAQSAFERALGLRPGCPDILGHYAAMLLATARPGPAEQMLREALLARPGHAALLNNLALALQAQNRTELAIEYLHDAIRCDPGFADAHYNLGCLMLLDDRQDEARACHERAVALKPLHGRALWARCMVEVPILYETPEQITLQRMRYSHALGRLQALAVDPSVAAALAGSAGASQPFFLPYQGQPDRALQAQYGTLMAQIRPAHGLKLATPPGPAERIRLGIVSGFFCEHTVWRLMLKGWLGELDRSRFEVTAYHTATTCDPQTVIARALCPRFISGTAAAVRDAILADRPHVLLYPEVGMDPAAAQLAAERLAPTQAVCWGQPETTGLPTMDLFLSSALMEPDQADQHYTERLIALPKLGICYQPDERVTKPISRAALKIRPDSVLFWCPQTLQKYLPQHDEVFVRIAAATGNCQFAFIGFAKSRTVTAHFHDRLRAAFTARGLDPERYLLMLPPLSQGRFLGVTRLADVVLDSIGWSGGKSTLDMLAETPVIVTAAGPLMRGRHTAGILTGMGVTDTVAADVDDYVRIATTLAQTPGLRAALRTRMGAGRRHILSDLAPIRAMEAVLTRAASGQLLCHDL